MIVHTYSVRIRLYILYCACTYMYVHNYTVMYYVCTYACEQHGVELLSNTCDVLARNDLRVSFLVFDDDMHMQIHLCLLSPGYMTPSTLKGVNGLIKCFLLYDLAHKCAAVTTVTASYLFQE